MAQFDLMKVRNTGELVVNCQSNLLRNLPTRFVIPLLPLDTELIPSGRLNPIFEVDGKSLLLATQYALSIPMSELRSEAGNLSVHSYEIVSALDTLISGA